MGGIAQRRVKLSGQWYEAGEPVPDELVDERLVMLGLVARAAAAPDVAGELAEAKARADAAEARLAELETRLSGIAARLATAEDRPPASGEEPKAKPKVKAAAKEAGASPPAG